MKYETLDPKNQKVCFDCPESYNRAHTNVIQVGDLKEYDVS